MTPSVPLPATLRVLQRGWLSSNSVVCHDDEGAGTVVDTGYVTHADQTAALVARALEGRALRRIVNTHLHSDHCGGNAALRAASGAEIVIPPGHAAAVAAWDESQLTYRQMGQQCPRFAFDRVLAPGESIIMGQLRWQAIAAPGHDPHQLVLWCAEAGVLISADVLWENGFGAIFPELDGEPSFAEQRALLMQVEALHPAVVIPGHGAPFSDITGALSRAYSRWSALAADPVRNARSVGRVLVKFYLLEVRETDLASLVRHFALTRLAQRLRDRYFPNRAVEDVLISFVDDLVRNGAARRDGERVLNVSVTE